jgi:tetratricopeptide (TPR) repeat protein
MFAVVTSPAALSRRAFVGSQPGLDRRVFMRINVRHCLAIVALALGVSATSALAFEDVDNADPAFYTKRGNELRDAGNIDEAIIHFQAASFLWDPNIAPRAGIAATMLDDDDYDGALDQLNRTIDQLKRNFETDKKELGLDEAQRRISSWSRRIYGDRSVAYYGLKEYDRAAQDCERALSFRPNDVPSLDNCGDAYSELGNFDRALQYFNTALDNKPGHPNALVGRGQTYLMMGRRDDAFNDCNKALQLEPRSGGARRCLGDLYRAQGNIPEAIRNYTELLSINPFSQVRDVLAELTHNPILKEKRVALVIGNGAYKSAPLDSSVNDANDVAAALTKLGFAVIKNTDLDLFAMQNIFKRFARRAKDADVALVYYSGHGGQYKDANYLVPVETGLQWLRDPTVGFAEYINLQGKVDGIKNLGRTRILIVDACRTEGGFENIEKKYGPDTRPLDAAQGMYIAYASAPDHYSYDGGQVSRNSPFTQALLRNLTTRGVELRELFTRVRNEAYADSGHKQISQTWDNMPNEFRFYPPDAQLIGAQ